MMAHDPRHRSRELLHSLLLGPVRSLGPAGLNVLLYPILIAHGGLAAVGVFGAINLVINFFVIADLGLSQYVGRAIARGDDTRDRIATDVRMICTSWIMATLVIAAAAFLLRAPLASVIGYVPTPASAAAIVLVFLTGGLALIYGFLGYVLTGAHLVSVSQINDLWASLVQFVVIVVLVWFLSPFLALATGFLVGYLVRAVGLAISVKRRGVLPITFFPVMPDPTRLAWLLRNSGSFALVQLAQRAYQVVYRTVILAIGGAPLLGLFETASRIPFLLEQAISNGLQSFFAIFSAADWQSPDGIARARALIAWVHRILLVTSVGALGAWIALAGPIIGLWLNIADPQLVFATRLFGLYNLVRAMNVFPYWALQARGGEGWLGSLQLGLVVVTGLALLAADGMWHISFTQVAGIIVVLGCVGEGFVAAAAQIRTRFLSVALGQWRGALPHMGALLLAGAALAIDSTPVLRGAALFPALRDGLLYGAAWLAVAFAAGAAHPRRMLTPPPH